VLAAMVSSRIGNEVRLLGACRREFREMIMTRLLSCFTMLLVTVPASSPFSQADDIPDFETDIVPVLKTHCFQCHGDGVSEGGLVLDQFPNNAMAQQNPAVWWNVLKNVRAGVMPPPEEHRLTVQERNLLIRWIKFSAFQIDPEEIDPGPRVARRLNRSEYGNTVSDLMGIDFDATLLFPPDDSGFGFDNVGDALSFSPLLMEKYLRAAQTIVAQAVPKATWIAPSQKVSGGEFRDREKNRDGNSVSGKEPVLLRTSVKIKTSGLYVIRNEVRLHGSFEFDPARYTVVFRIDGQERTRNEYGWDENKLVKSELAEELTSGEHDLSFELIPIKPEASAEESSNKDSFVRFEIDTVRMEGPQGAVGTEHPRNYDRFFTRDTPPTDSEQRRQYASEVLQRFSTRAFRSPANPATIDRLLEICDTAWQQPDSTFESGIGEAMVAVLASPRFLFRVESVETPQNGSRFTDVSEYELASRLSYFLWSTMPDEELLELAEQQQLRSQLSAQVDRMLRHDRSREFLRNFVGQWLRTRDVTQITVDAIAVLGYQQEYDELRAKFRGRGRVREGEKLSAEEEQQRARIRELREISDKFGQELKRAMQKETELCVEYIARENRSVLELLDSRYTFLNQALAEHYGIPGVEGKDMRKVDLPEDSPRGGILGHGSMLLVTSNPTRTSPVKRGLYILDNLLGTPSPPAPPNVPELAEAAKKFGDREPTPRELLAVHRESALCSSCHSRMDPLGLALENFSAVGTWRTEDKGMPIDASGQLISGEAFNDVRELKRVLRENRATDFYRCLTQKMLIFATGRGLEFSDEHTVDLIVARLEANDGRFKELIEGIVLSAPFQKRR
jgi:PAS domain-containing protein